MFVKSKILPKGLNISVTLMSVRVQHEDILNKSNRGHNFIDSFVLCPGDYPTELGKKNVGQIVKTKSAFIQFSPTMHGAKHAEPQ